MPKSPAPAPAAASTSAGPGTPVVTSSAATAGGGEASGQQQLQVAHVLRKMEEHFAGVSRQLVELERRMSSLEVVAKEMQAAQREQAEDRRKLDRILDRLKSLPPTASTSTSTSASASGSAAAGSGNAGSAAGLQYAAALAPAAGAPYYPTVRLPALQPATSLITSLPQAQAAGRAGSSKAEQEELDRQMALRLQQELNAGAAAGGGAGGSDLLPGVDTRALHSKPTGAGAGAGAGGSGTGSGECPMCGASMPLAALEAHVARHFGEEAGGGADGKDGGKEGGKDGKDKEGFFSWLFARQQQQEADKNKDAKSSTSASASASSSAQAQPGTRPASTSAPPVPAYRTGSAANPQVLNLNPGPGAPAGFYPAGMNPVMYRAPPGQGQVVYALGPNAQPQPMFMGYPNPAASGTPQIYYTPAPGQQ